MKRTENNGNNVGGLEIRHANEYEPIIDNAAAELKLVIQRMSERENDEREKLSKRYTADEREARIYDQGFSDGYEAGRQKGLAEGIDIGLKQAAKEQKEKSEEDQAQ